MKKSARVKLKEMAEIYGCCEKTFRRQVDKCGIPHILLGRTMLFDVQEVEDYLRERTRAKQQESMEIKTRFRIKRKLDPVESIKTTDRYESLLGLR